MKKKVLLMIAAVFVVTFWVPVSSFAGPVLKIGVDTAGKVRDNDVDTGFTFTGELQHDATPNFAIGAGASYLLTRDEQRSDNRTRDISYLPLYGFIKLQSASTHVRPYLVIQFGYNISLIGTSGGIHMGGGVGADYKEKYLFEVLYQHGGDTSEYQRISLNVGYRF